MLGIKNLADETQEYQVFRADVSAGTAELLFTLPDRATLIKVDEQYIYAEYAINDDNAFDEVTVYDHQGTEIETLAVPQTWATDGKLVLGLDHERNCSVITADGQYLMENLPVEDAKLVDGSVYYLTGDDTSMTLYRLTANGKDTVGTVPCTGRTSGSGAANGWWGHITTTRGRTMISISCKRFIPIRRSCHSSRAQARFLISTLRRMP